MLLMHELRRQNAYCELPENNYSVNGEVTLNLLKRDLHTIVILIKKTLKLFFYFTVYFVISNYKNLLFYYLCTILFILCVYFSFYLLASLFSHLSVKHYYII